MTKFYGLCALFCSCLVLASVPSSPAPVVLERMSSPYNGDVAVVDYQGARYLLSQSRLGGVLDSAMDLQQKDHLTLDYIQVMALLTALHPAPQTVYDLGLGGGELLRFHLHHYAASHVDSVEIDPGMIALAKKYFKVMDPRHRLIQGEGFEVLAQQPGLYSVIWVDDVISKEGPKAYVKAAHLGTLKDRLADGGVLVANLGESRKPEFVSEVEDGYLRGFTHGIRVKSPVPQYAETLKTLRGAAFADESSAAPALAPSYIVAVGNQPGLTCARFGALYKKWTEQKLVTVKWPESSPDQPESDCQDLKK